MDAAVSNAEEYYERFHGNRTSSQILHRILSVLKRLSKQRAQNNHEIPSGSLPDLERRACTLSSKPEAEQRAYVEQVLAQMSARSRKITTWRMEGHTWRQIADRLNVNHAAVQRTYRRELRTLEARGISISNAKSTLERRAPGHRGKPHQEAKAVA
jgi:DNA-binding CsgD family transcriptional regulator